MKDDRIATAYSLRKKVTSGISNNEYFNDYFSSIDLDTEGMIFKLLSMISNNKSARKDVLSVVEPGRSLGSLIDLEKPRTLLYFLSVLYKILQTKKELEFTNKLIASGQLDDLLKIVIQMSKIETKNFETVSAVIKAVFPVINFFLADYPEGGFKMPQAISAQYFESVVSLLQYLFEVQPITTSSDELDKVTICTLSHFETLILKSNCLAQKPNVNWTELFILALVTTSNESMKAHFSRIFEETIMKPQITESVFMEILTPLYKSALDRACQQVTQARHYFNLGSNILRNCPDEAKRAMLISFVSFELVWDKLLPTLLSSMDELLMVSMLKFLAATLQGKSSLTDWVSQNKDYLIQLTSRCLIDKSGKQGSKPICHSTSSRSAFFSFIKAVSSIEESIRKDIYSYFLNIINKGKWRRKLYKDWNIEIAQQQETKSTPYIGLVNLGSTCYMNSIFQQIFAVTEFRNFLIDTEVDYGDDIESNPIFQFQIVMKGLRDAVRQTYNPKNFCRVFTNFDGTPINVTEQMDADEFFNNLMDKLEGELKKNNQDGVIKKTFGGKLVKEIISSDCEHKSTVISDFLTLSIDVKGITSITQSLEKLVAGEILDGDNKYNCETCQKKVKALMRESLYTLPNRLVIVLKRFEFKYETMTKQKLNSYCEFPDFLDMKKFSNEYLTENPEHRHPDNYFEYNLKGITIHRGTAESGHYWSLIK
jgi:ubiquitin C-terminal hydrolase